MSQGMKPVYKRLALKHYDVEDKRCSKEYRDLYEEIRSVLVGHAVPIGLSQFVNEVSGRLGRKVDHYDLDLAVGVLVFNDMMTVDTSRPITRFSWGRIAGRPHEVAFIDTAIPKRDMTKVSVVPFEEMNTII